MNNKVTDFREMETQEKNNSSNTDLIKKYSANMKTLDMSKTKGMSQFKTIIRVV